MLKIITTIIAGVIIGGFGTYFTLDWQEEKLIYSLTTPAKFGKISYQNITIFNTGWNPAVNIKLYIEHPSINFSAVQSTIAMKNLSNEKNGIVSIERVRRDESIIISLAYEGQPLFGNEIVISSDRSIAEQIEVEGKEFSPPLLIVIFSILGALFVVGVFSAIAIPAYRGYMITAKKHAESLMLDKQKAMEEELKDMMEDKEKEINKSS